jgi:transcriptional regulator with XRE-family HTH domain
LQTFQLHVTKSVARLYTEFGAIREEQRQTTITNWENGLRSPTISDTAKIAEFLGYDSLPEGTTLAERLVITERHAGYGRGTWPESCYPQSAPVERDRFVSHLYQARMSLRRADVTA